ncbi:MAG: HAMP domain-containing sensor histidine kinase [Candidatus Shapirobacteria bacterium]|jgi:signal transduction histidine kinase
MLTEEEIKLMKEENERLLNLSSVKSDMVSISAHQIRTALSAQKWIIKMFIDGDLGKLSAEQENLMHKAYESNERAISIVSELLLANKTENVTEKQYAFAEVDLAELIDGSIFDFSGETHSKGIEIIFLTPKTKPPLVRGDKEKLRVVFQNILENAIKYSNAHGKIFITLTEKDGFIETSVKDTGIGISEDGKKKIFEKFYRDPGAQKKAVIGSGIGLFTIKKIVETHGGKIWFDSIDGDGTTFFFTIPIYK